MSRPGAFLVVIPARFASSRLHGKPLADIGGKPMVVRVAERARASGAKAVCRAGGWRPSARGSPPGRRRVGS